MISQREAALSTFFSLFAGLNGNGYRTIARLPNWTIDWRELPALIQMDGGDLNIGGDDSSSGISGVMRLSLPVTMIVGIRTESEVALAPALSEARAEVRRIVGDALRADCTLGGLIDNVRYEGSEEPVRDPTPGAAPHGVFYVNYALVMTENEFDPYSAQ